MAERKRKLTPEQKQYLIDLKKKPNEDDDDYKYRCVAMACMVAKRKRRNQIRR